MPSILRTLLPCALALCALPVNAEPIRRVVPYTGHLDSDGLPFDGEVQMTFTIYDTEAGPQADGEPWRECHSQVAVRAGAFTVRLGAPVGPGATPTDLSPLLARDVQQFLAIAVRPRNLLLNPAGDCGELGGPWVTFGARQAISPVPQALWSAQATDLMARSVTTTTLSASTVSASSVSTSTVTTGALTTTADGVRIENGGTLSFGPDGHIDGVFQHEERVQDFTCQGSLVDTIFGPQPHGYSACANTVDLRAADARSVCFLQEAGVQIEADHFVNNQMLRIRCWVGIANGRWVLGSNLEGRYTKTHRCAARCLRW